MYSLAARVGRGGGGVNRGYILFIYIMTHCTVMSAGGSVKKLCGINDIV